MIRTTDEQRTNHSLQAYPLTLEHVAYGLIALVSLITRLWALDGHALHHDETLHAYYSWRIFAGEGYMHDPLLHGPFLYYTGALMFFLFGDSDTTARLGFALSSVVLTLLPYLVRREIGRTTALLVSLFLLISPVFLYIGRFARHDSYSVTFEMLVFVAIVRYASTRQTRWLCVGAAAFGLMFTNQETSYLFLLIMTAPLVLAFLWHTFKAGIPILAVAAVATAALVFVLPGKAQMGGDNNAVRDPTTGAIVAAKPGPIFGWGPLETSDNGYALQIRNRADNNAGASLLENLVSYSGELWKFFRHPAVLISSALLLLTLGAMIWLIWVRQDANKQSAWQRANERGSTTVQVSASLGKDRRVLIAVAIFLTIYALFFTAFFTNLLGVITGVTGSLLYWLAQHDVQRGSQPAYYYVLMLLVYEPLLVVWGSIALVLMVVAVVRSWVQRIALTIPPAILLAAWWSVAALALYSWAGEKMPWLTIHITLPLALVAAWACQWFIWKLDNGSWATRPYILLTLLFIGAFAWAAMFSYIEMTSFVNPTEPTSIPGIVYVVLILVLIVMLLILAVINWGWRWAFSVVALAVTLGGSMYSIRSAYRLAYQVADVPREMMIYTQTSPDVRRVVRTLEEISIRRTNGLDMPIIYDNETVWLWYLRNFTRATNTGPQLNESPAPGVMAVVMLQENLDRSAQTRESLTGFRIQRYPLRWWLPENEVYRLESNWTTAPIENVSLLARTIRAPTSDETLLQAWNYMIYRTPPAPLGSTDFVLAVRPEIADQFGTGVGASLRQNEP